MDINAAFPSDHLKASDLQGREVNVTISHVEMKDIGGDPKPVVYFIGKEKGLVLNKTNASAISQMHGHETDMWVDRPITLFPSQTDFQGKIVPCIRVKIGAPVYHQAPVSRQPPPGHPAAMGAGPIDDEIPFAPETR